MQTSKQWTHQRRTGGAVDPVDALIEVSVSAAASGDVLNAIRLVRFAEEMAKFQRKREVARLLSVAQPLMPQKAPPTPAPPPASAPEPAPAPALYRPPSRVTDPLAFTPEEEARFAAIRAMQTQGRDGQQ